jgi:phytoene synthase
MDASLTSTTWESNLLARAYEALQGGASAVHRTVADQTQLERAYAYCAGLTARHSRSFFLASSLLPPEKRKAIRALYAFCRKSDDLVDNPASHGRGSSRAALAAWGRQALLLDPSGKDLIALAWTDARQRYKIPYRYAEQLIEGVGRDLDQARYESFEDLAVYAYGVASTVGLMSMHITGYDSLDALPYAVVLGVALQLTNILRDVGEDWRSGRLYLPLQELARFGLSEADLAAGRVDARWRAFMRYQIERNRRLYAEALPGIRLLHPDGRLAVAAAADFYQAILAEIEQNDYDVFQRRAHLSGWQKLRRLPGLWWHWRA